jgi:hypothetical protein
MIALLWTFECGMTAGYVPGRNAVNEAKPERTHRIMVKPKLLALRQPRYLLHLAESGRW